jgi:hypothetical protein
MKDQHQIFLSLSLIGSSCLFLYLAIFVPNLGLFSLIGMYAINQASILPLIKYERCLLKGRWRASGLLWRSFHQFPDGDFFGEVMDLILVVNH